MTVYLFDGGHNEVAHMKMQEPIAIDGKAPGRARIEEFPLTVNVPRDVAARTTSLEVSVTYDGKQFGLWGIPLDTIVQAIVIIIKSL
ncbi:MAG: hypothetical protein FJ100_22360 [Deltaproteobacteria bacterium]|nr:hypothetical protein [Deltaproteobacteria bacterium]